METKTNENEIDVKNIMGQIREQINIKKQSGIYTDKEIKAVSDKKLSYDSADYENEIMQFLAFLNEKWDSKGEEAITSHRKVLGPIIVLTKKLIRSILRPFTNTLLFRQSEFNSNLVKLLNIITYQLPKQDKHNQMIKQFSGLEKNQDILERRHDQLQAHFLGLFKKVDAWHDELKANVVSMRDNVASIGDDAALIRGEFDRLHQRHVELFQKAMEVRQENILQKNRLDRMLIKLRDKYELPKDGVPTLIKEKENFMDHSYFLFENKFRGSREEIMKRQEAYLPLFKNSDNVLDIGCGRGEFLQLLHKEGGKPVGIDINEDMIYTCKEKKLNVHQVDAISYLSSIKDNSLGGIFASHIIEHMDNDLLVKFINLCFAKLKNNSYAVFETPNPESIIVSAINFYLDISHVKHIHPEAVKFLLESNGFVDINIKYLSPFPDETKLQPISKNSQSSKILSGPIIDLMNSNSEKLNNILYGYQDYAAICSK